MRLKKPLTGAALPVDALDYFRQQGARGGTIAGQSMTTAQKKARASKAGQASARARTKKKLAKPGKG